MKCKNCDFYYKYIGCWEINLCTKTVIYKKSRFKNRKIIEDKKYNFPESLFPYEGSIYIKNKNNKCEDFKKIKKFLCFKKRSKYSKLIYNIMEKETNSDYD